MTSSLSDKLTAALKSPSQLSTADIQIASSRGFKVTATVISKDFEGQDEVDRQQLVWEAVLSQLKGDDAAKVEFIFTFTPHEAEELGLTN